MVIMIGAPSCTGKTLMAQKLLEKYAIPYYSIDHLKMGLFRARGDCGYHPENDDDHIAKILWPIVRETVHTVIENDQNLIVEGCYYFPDHAQQWSDPYANHIVSVFIVFSAQYIQKNFTEKILRYQTIIEGRLPETRPVEVFLREHDRYRRRCLASGTAFFEIQENYAEEMKQIYAWLDEQIAAMGNH